MRTFRTLALLLAFLTWVPVVQAAGPYREAALGALSWIASQQQPDGSFPGFGPGSTADAVFAICAVDGDPNGFLQGENSPITFLAARAGELASSPGSAAKVILAAVCAGKDPRRFGGTDLVAALEKAYDVRSGSYGADLAGHALVLLALSAAGRPIPAAAVVYLRQAQTPEGGWAWDGSPASGGADTNSTALAVQALRAAGVVPSDPAVQSALSYFHTQQNADGGFPYAKPSPWGSASDTNSTAYVVQALLAAGEDPEGPAWTVEGRTPLSFLRQMQLPSGAFLWQAQVPGENALATYQAVPALMLRPFPLARMSAGEAALLPATGGPGLGGLGGIFGLGMFLAGLLLRRRHGR
ncbi:MAG: cell wall anchor protein [Chloroflexia bacterium]